MKEHRQEVEQQKGQRYTSAKQTAETETCKSATADHATQENDFIDRCEVTVVSRESDRVASWIREAVQI
jgi:hypothetical protein